MTAHRQDRRAFLTTVLAAGVWPAARLQGIVAPHPEGELVGLVPLSSPTAGPLDTRMGEGLDGRLFTDLSGLRPDRLTTPTDRFFVRTTCLPEARTRDPWTIRVQPAHGPAVTIGIGMLQARAADMGDCLIECSGNNAPGFGLISSARWRGVPLLPLLADVLDGAVPEWLLVAGVDDMSGTSRTSRAGASWVFARPSLTPAFLAIGMNGGPLPADHGGPVRLVAPGWYGCACVKWVDAIAEASGDMPAPPQMIEFASRTHQRADARLVRDFEPATIDHAAMPVRVEHWVTPAGHVYRTIGILWGGSAPTDALQIRFGREEPFVPVSDCRRPATTHTWSLWTHDWQPRAPGRYEIGLRIADPSIRTRRLDIGFYQRSLTIRLV